MTLCSSHRHRSRPFPLRLFSGADILSKEVYLPSFLPTHVNPCCRRGWCRYIGVEEVCEENLVYTIHTHINIRLFFVCTKKSLETFYFKQFTIKPKFTIKV